MTYPMPPELLEQLGLDPCADADPQWPEDHDALGWGRRTTCAELDELYAIDPCSPEEGSDGC
jgi:hypothetical protein